jgi:hypothetical protein
MSTILIFKEKHGDRYFDASTPEAKSAAFLKILRERFNSGYYYEEPKSPEHTLTKDEKALLSLSEEQLDALPAPLQASTKTQVSRVRRKLRGVQEEYEQAKLWWDSVVALLALDPAEAVNQKEERRIRVMNKTYSVSSAEDLLDARKDYEYEDYWVESLESVN